MVFIHEVKITKNKISFLIIGRKHLSLGQSLYHFIIFLHEPFPKHLILKKYLLSLVKREYSTKCIQKATIKMRHIQKTFQ